MAGIMGLFASELDEFVADYDNQFWDASFHGETYPPRIIMERSTPPLYRVEDDGSKTLEPNPTIQIIGSVDTEVVSSAIEEMAELTKELCKAQRTIFAARTGLGDGRIDNLDEIAEEIADVQIVLEELEQLYGAKKKVQKIRQQKLARLEMRIEKAREERGDNREHTAKWEDPGQKGDLWYEKLNGPGPDPKGARGAWGHCPKCGASDCEWDAETDVCTCKACGYTN